jgi:hypothetical protein
MIPKERRSEARRVATTHNKAKRLEQVTPDNLVYGVSSPPDGPRGVVPIGTNIEQHVLTPLQNDPQQHRGRAKHRKCLVSHGHDLIPDSGFARKSLQKSRRGPNAAPNKLDFTTGAPVWTRVQPSPDKWTKEALSRTPIASAVGGISKTLTSKSRISSNEVGAIDG